jgi:phage-related minor tail protein
MTEERRIQLVAEVNTTQTREGFNEISQQATTMAESVARSGGQAEQAVSDIGSGADRSARTVESAQRNLIGSIQRTTASMEAGSRSSSQYYEVLARQRGVDPSILAPYLEQLRAIEAAQAAAAQSIQETVPSVDSLGASAAQTANALQGVPAQFTDIVTSIQAGQNPFTVFLQQGGQLRDTFGSAGAAARGLATYVASLVNPLTVAGAAAAALGAAYYLGSQETDAYNRALILTGNIAGTTGDELTAMARDIAKTAGVQGDAAQALTALAGAGNISVDNLKRFGAASVRAQKEIGVSIDDTTASFAQLGEAPLQASEKLNEQYHYLTASVYAQIKALQDQGKTEEAGATAQTAFADALESRSSKMTANLGAVEKAWRGITGVAKGAWDAMLDVGREDTLEQKLAKVRTRIAKGQKAFDASVGGNSEDRMSLKKNQAEEQSLIKQIDANARLAVIEGARAKLDEDSITWQKEGEQYLSRRVQMERDIAQTREKGLAAGASDTEINARVLNVQKKYSDIFNDGINSQIEAVKRRGVIEEEVAKRTASSLAAIQTAGTATSLAAQISYAEQVEANDQAALGREKARLQDILRLTKGKQNSETEQASIRGAIEDVEAKQLTRKLKLKDDIYVLDIKDSRQAAANLDALAGKRDAELQSLVAQVKAQKDSNSLIGASKQQINAFNLALAEESATRLENQAAIIGNDSARQREAETMRASAAEIRALAEARAAGILKTEDFEQQKKLWDSIDQTAHDTFVSIFDSGKSAFDRLRDTLKNGLLDLLYQMTIKRWIFNIGAEVSGYTGIAASSGSVVSGLGSLGSAGTLISGASAIKSGLGLVNGGLIGAGNSIGGLGSALGSTAIADFGAGLSGQAAAAAQAYGGTLSTAAGFGASINTAIAAVPGWGWAALGVAAIAGMSGLFSGGGPESNTRLQFASNNAVGNINNNERGESWAAPYIGNGSTSSLGTFGVRQTFWGDATGEVVQSFIKTVGQTDDALAAFMTSAEKASVTGYLTGKTYTANTGAEGSNPNATGELDKVFADRINSILTGVEPGLASLVSGFTGTSQALATEAAALLSYRAALTDSGEAVFGVKVTMQEIAALKQPTETTSVALARVTSEFTATSQVAQMLGLDVAKAFGATGLASEAARAQLIQLSGGMATFTAQASAYAQTYLTDEERNKVLVKQVKEQMSALGLAAVTTKDQFKALVMGLDLSSEADAKRYAELMKVSGDFAKAADATAAAIAKAADATAAAIAKADEAAKATAGLDGQIYDLTHTAAEALARQRQVELSAMTATDAALQRRINALNDEKAATQLLLGGVSSAYSDLQTVIGRQKDVLSTAYQASVAATQANIDSLTSSTGKLQSLSQSLRSTMDSMSIPGAEKSDRQAAQAQIASALAIAKAGGPLPDAEALKGALAIVAKDASSQFSSFADYQRDLYRTKNSVGGLAGVTDAQLSTEQRTLKALQETKKAAEDYYRQQLSALDATLGQAKTQTDLLGGIYTSLMTLPQALSNLFKAVEVAKTNAPVAASSGIAELYGTLLGRAPDESGLAFYKEILGKGYTLEDVKKDILGSPEYKKLHPFAVGTNSVPQTMAALVHEGERIIPAADNRELMRRLSGPAGDNSALVAEVRALREEVAKLQAPAMATAENTKKASTTLQRVTQGNDYFVIKEVTA